MNGFDFFKGNLALKITDSDMKRAIEMAQEYQNEMSQILESPTKLDGLTYEELAKTEPDDNIDSDIDFFEID